MKISEEKFKELKQGDKIEYLLRRDLIEKRFPKNTFFFMCKLSCFILFAVLVLALLLRLNYGEQLFKTFLNGVSSLGFIIGILLFVGLISDLFSCFLKIKNRNELNKEFFNVLFKVTPKKK